MSRLSPSHRLPSFPWDSLASARQVAASHPEGIVDLSVGSPVDPVGPTIQLALCEAAAEPGYPATIGTAELRAAIVSSLERRYGISGLTDDAVLPVIGTKEAIAWLPFLLGVQGTVVIPTLAYPTYEVGALLAGATVLRADDPADIPDPGAVDLMYVNSPSNPTGAVASAGQLSKIVEWARQHDIIVASDECYLGLGWDDAHRPISILHPDVSQGDHRNLLAIHSLSKTSNLAGYRAGFFAGDTALIAELIELRKQAGLMVPGPIQHAVTAALNFDEQEQLQKLIYAQRRATLLPVLLAAGFRIEHSHAGLYIWATRGENGWDTVNGLAERGILVAPGEFYGEDGTQFVRISLTASDERIAAAAARLSE